MFLKIVLIGDTGVGKTSLIEQYVYGKTPGQGKPTIGAAFHNKTVSLYNQEYTCQLWDTAG